MLIRGAIFDFDGTLVDSMPVWDGVWAKFLVRHGIEPSADIAGTYKALTLSRAAEYYRENYGVCESAEDICREINDMVMEGYRTVRPKPYVPEFLDKLRAEGVRSCIATNTVRSLVESVLKRLGLDGYFDFILPCSEVGVGKERPDIFYIAAERMGSSVGETAVFEDAPHAIKTARGAGFPTVAVYDSSYAAQERDIRAISSVYIMSFKELLEKTLDI